MIMKINNKKIEITDKNARAYEKMNGVLPDENDIRVYVAALYHPDSIEKCIATFSDSILFDLINHCIEQEVRDCCGDIFYEEA